MDQEQLITNITVKQLKEIIAKSTQEVVKSQNQRQFLEKGLMSRAELAEFFDTSYVTIRSWVKSGQIPKPIRKGRRVYWLRSQIFDDLK